MLMLMHLFFRKTSNIDGKSWGFWISTKRERYRFLGNELDKNRIE